MDFNINDKVRVRLTAHGRAVHATSYAILCERKPALSAWLYRPPTEDAGGWSEWQIWSLMATFGAHTGRGMPQCFEQNTIRIVTPTVEPTPFTDQRARNGDQE